MVPQDDCEQSRTKILRVRMDRIYLSIARSYGNPKPGLSNPSAAGGMRMMGGEIEKRNGSSRRLREVADYNLARVHVPIYLSIYLSRL
ncbi:unnamed protein product [Sphagnum jensenii]|uniref:Uncharacterized protein n=1 Tax=Sphagnum jensenii TaxID=128206 RepID=A0ABP1BXK3_9BRYO